jgi:hypothetical protein
VEKRNLSQASINRRKKVGAELTRTTSGIGLASLGALGAAAGAKKFGGRGVLRGIDAAKAAKFHESTKNKLITTGIVTSGVSGLNGFNNASWQAAEARQRKAAVVKGFRASAFGVMHD